MTAERDDRQRDARDVGSDSPASRTAKAQRVSGTAGGPQEGAPGKRGQRQPPQGSGRRGARHEHKPEQRKGFDASSDPDRQGEGAPGPEQIRDRVAGRGISARSGSHRARGEDTEAVARSGAPQEGHTRGGRQSVPGQPERTDRGS
jgi:hypothetical protein